ncbi:MAG TPA: hypothetical protein VHP58_05845 [Alphaproteobacteria bacterium]|nr:hypothetical protein [Alphaproteobacteria bacterium]
MKTIYYVLRNTYGKGLDKDGHPTQWLQRRQQVGPFVFADEAENYRQGLTCQDTAVLYQTTEVKELPLYETAAECKLLP